MKKTGKILLMLLILPLLLGWDAFADVPGSGTAQDTLNDLYNEQLEASGADELWDSLPAPTREFLDQLGIKGMDAGSYTALQPQDVANNLLILLTQQAKGPLRAAGVLLGVVLLYALMDGMRQTVREESVSAVFGTICAVTACAALLVPLSGCIRLVSEAAKSASVFMFSFVPVYAGVMLASGQAVSAASYQSVVLFAAELLSLASTHLLVPLMTVSLALGLTGAVTPGMKLDTVGGFINKACGWILGLITTIFTGLLSLQSLVGAAADTLTGRAIRFSLGAFVPVVGGALSESFNAVRGCLDLLKSTLGAFGILAIVLILLPPLLQCILWLLSLSFCTMVAEIFELNTVASLFKTAQGVLKTLIGVLTACSLFMIVATSVMTMAGRGSV